ncbi:Fumarate hydratase, mitochondrial [Tolypocladium paradoxum]|uniref:Fumarate hydratase, mitochondrial n=1 Tax=Tolypocladium paradoxum TaxID=94208 RepID=A0A2S4KSZ8_9HYPO|nr:Fumarate hydratase, mitochondrial [Tolypocladium paradoxum]
MSPQQQDGVTVMIPLDPDSPTFVDRTRGVALGPTLHHTLPAPLIEPAISKILEEVKRSKEAAQAPIGTGRPAGCFRDPAKEPPEMDKYEALGIPRPAPKGCLKPQGNGKGKNREKLVRFNDDALAACLKTGARVEPRGNGELAKQRFEAAHQELKARKAHQKLKARKAHRELKARKTHQEPKARKAHQKPKAQKDLLTDEPALDQLPPSPIGAKTDGPRSAVINARLEEAWHNANALSKRAIERGYMDFAHYVCKWGSKRHQVLSAVQTKFEGVPFGSFEGPEREYAIDGGVELVSLSHWYHDIATAMSEPRTRSRYRVVEWAGDEKFWEEESEQDRIQRRNLLMAK